MSEEHAALQPAMRIQGAQSVTVLSIASGTVVWSVEAGDPRLVAGTGTAIADLVSAAGYLARLTGSGQFMEDLVLTSASWFHVLRMAGGPERDPQVVHLLLDRRVANLALARLELKVLVETGIQYPRRLEAAPARAGAPPARKKRTPKASDRETAGRGASRPATPGPGASDPDPTGTDAELTGARHPDARHPDAQPHDDPPPGDHQHPPPANGDVVEGELIETAPHPGAGRPDDVRPAYVDGEFIETGYADLPGNHNGSYNNGADRNATLPNLPQRNGARPPETVAGPAPTRPWPDDPTAPAEPASDEPIIGAPGLPTWFGLLTDEPFDTDTSTLDRVLAGLRRLA